MKNPNYTQAIRFGVLVFYGVALCLPAYIFLHDRGGMLFLPKGTITDQLQQLFPLLGLYAFTFVSLQVLLATNLYWLRRYWPHAIKLHRFQGMFALLFAVLHPTFILLGYGIINYLHFRYVAPNLRWWLLPAYTALTVLLGTTLTALLAWRGMDIPWWRKLHRLNYAVFGLAWLHSWFIGTDTQLPQVRYVWLVYLLLVLASTAGKYRRLWHRVQSA